MKLVTKVGSVLALLLCLLSLGANAEPKTVRLVSDPYPPYVMDEPDYKGFVTDMATKILQDAGYHVEYISVPFKRALIGLDQGIYDGLLAVSPGRKDFVYPEHAFGRSQTYFFVVKGNPWRFNGVESLKDVKLGVVAGYQFSGGMPSHEDIDGYILSHRDDATLIQFNYGRHALLSNMNMLELGRIDAIVEDNVVFWHTARKAGVADKFQVAGNLSKVEKMTVGFNLKNPRARELAKVISDGVPKLKASGDYDKILAKYNLN